MAFLLGLPWPPSVDYSDRPLWTETDMAQSQGSHHGLMLLKLLQLSIFGLPDNDFKMHKWNYWHKPLRSSLSSLNATTTTNDKVSMASLILCANKSIDWLFSPNQVMHTNWLIDNWSHTHTLLKQNLTDQIVQQIDLKYN